MKDEEGEFKELAQSIQKKIDEKEEEDYSKEVLKNYRNPQNFKPIQKPDATATIKGSCGDTMKIELKINQNVINDVGFWTDGCGPSIACGNKLLDMVKGKKISEATKINNKKLLKELNGLPKENIHCAKLAVDTLKKAIMKYQKKKIIS